MKHITYADKSILVGDEAADVLLELARVVAEENRAETVTLWAISTDGNTVEASFLLSVSSDVMVESTNSEVQPPDNAEAVAGMRNRIAAITRPSPAEPGPPWVESLDEMDYI